MVSKKLKKSSGVKVAEKPDLYHDIEPEKKKKLKVRNMRSCFLNLRLNLLNFRNG